MNLVNILTLKCRVNKGRYTIYQLTAGTHMHTLAYLIVSVGDQPSEICGVPAHIPFGLEQVHEKPLVLRAAARMLTPKDNQIKGHCTFPN